MRDEMRYAVDKLENAFNKLKEGTEEAKDELDKDGVIQRFEFTFELFWKTLKIFLKDKGIDAKTPKDTLKEAFKIGWVKEEEECLCMLEDRNSTSHIYDKKTAEEIFERIRDGYVAVIGAVLGRLKNIGDR